MEKDLVSRAPLRLLFDCHTFDVGPQGTTTFLASVLNALPQAARERGDTPVEIICAAQSRAAVERFVRVPFRYEQSGGGFVTRNLRSLPRIASDSGADWTVSQYVRPFISRARTLSVIHDVLFLDYPQLFSWRYRFVRRLMFGWAARHSDKVATVSVYSRDRIGHHFDIEPNRIAVLPNAVGEIGPVGLDGQRRAGPELRLLYVSRLERRKRQDWCVRAAKELGRAGVCVTLTIVGSGSGEYAEQVAVAARAAKENVRIRLLVNIDDDMLCDLYRDADIFLFPSECEGFGIPVIEASAFGIPCVVADNSALSELRDSYVGAAFQSDNFDAFLSAILAVRHDLPVLRARAIRAAPQVRMAHRWVNVAARMLDLLEDR